MSRDRSPRRGRAASRDLPRPVLWTIGFGGILLEDMVVPASGGVGLQAETGKFEFRNIRVKELP